MLDGGPIVSVSVCDEYIPEFASGEFGVAEFRFFWLRSLLPSCSVISPVLQLQ